MSEMIWFNGQVMPMSEAHIGVEDRGFQFADGIYEVIRLYRGKPFTLQQHMERLKRSCADIDLELSIGIPLLAGEIEKFVAASGLVDGMIYLQITRGDAPRNHVFPECRQTVLFYVRPLPPVPVPGTAPPVKLLSVLDQRWRRCWVKSIALLANVLAKNTAVAAGADEAAMVEDGWVAECSASNLFIVRNNTLLTHPVGPRVLPGITRQVLLELAEELGQKVVERPITEAECLSADEVFITSTTREIGWVNEWNRRPIGRGKCGQVTLRLHQALQERVKREIA